MQDLTGDSRYPAALVPSSMSAGGEVHPNPASLGAVGSQPISTPAVGVGQAPETLPEPSNSLSLPVNPQKGRLTYEAQPPTKPDDQPNVWVGYTTGDFGDSSSMRHPWRGSPSA